jgi:hypothetical protein
LGKTGSVVVDKSIASVEWYHLQLNRIDNLSDRQAIDYLRQRLGYSANVKLTTLERRKEIAGYCRKLVWLESINMLDSKSAGNCLPGTIQFAQQLGLPVPSEWNNYSVDARQLLRRWKEKSYGVNRLLLPAIDSAIKRVRTQLLSMACFW